MPSTHDTPALLSEYLTKAQFAREMSVTERTLDNWQRRRAGPPRAKLGNIVLYHRDDVKAWLRERATKAA